MLEILNRNAERWALLLFYTLLVVTMAVEVIRREVFHFSSIWGEEIVRYAFIYLVWIGAASAVRERAHIRIDVLFNYVGARTKAALYLFGDLVMLGVACLAVWWSFETLAVSWKFDSVSHGLRVSMVWFLAAVPIGFALMIFRLVQSLIRDARDLAQGRPPFEGERLFD
ncbi:TRAP transporter small permease [Paralimibaculum aggregatum]|uniref:TRAP transporter small permease protein n=1 Tax=Paralimibaculum aggregatum TaxID=3036245 RepID=A0ABQ6LSV2_9RHOB|nr:TRAP transporter small permease [Limibaculum sp. NKW23]GMG85147.1 TRAP transporter small permease [Limibaculum sp. NKW23]